MRAEIVLSGNAKVLIVGDDHLISRISLLGTPFYPEDVVSVTVSGSAAFRDAVYRVVAYLKAKTCDLSDIDVRSDQLPDFTRKVLLHLRRNTECGETITYGELALSMGMRGYARAVGQAVKRNPVPIIIPCHRVVASTGLGGFSAGVSWKEFLLRLESEMTR